MRLIDADLLGLTDMEIIMCDGDYKEALKMLIDKIEHAPTIEQEPQWIPCSERFPEESGTYAVTAHDGATKRVTYAKYQKRLKRWELTGARAYWRILAWMPLPEPARLENV